MKRSTVVTAGVLVLTIAVILVGLLLYTGSGPSFRAADHASYEDCLRNIPVEWGPGSMERSGSEDACWYVHRPR